MPLEFAFTPQKNGGNPSSASLLPPFDNSPFAFPRHSFSSEKNNLCYLSPHSLIPSNYSPAYACVWLHKKEEGKRRWRSHSAEWKWRFQLPNFARFSVGSHAGGDVKLVFWVKEKVLMKWGDFDFDNHSFGWVEMRFEFRNPALVRFCSVLLLCVWLLCLGFWNLQLGWSSH